MTSDRSTTEAHADTLPEAPSSRSGSSKASKASTKTSTKATKTSTKDTKTPEASAKSLSYADVATRSARMLIDATEYALVRGGDVDDMLARMVTHVAERLGVTPQSLASTVMQRIAALRS